MQLIFIEYYEGWCTKKDVESMLEAKQLEYGVHVNITRYHTDEDGHGHRETLDPEHGRVADGGEVWDMFKEGCSVRLLRCFVETASNHCVSHLPSPPLSFLLCKL